MKIGANQGRDWLNSYQDLGNGWSESSPIFHSRSCTCLKSSNNSWIALYSGNWKRGKINSEIGENKFKIGERKFKIGGINVERGEGLIPRWGTKPDWFPSGFVVIPLSRAHFLIDHLVTLQHPLLLCFGARFLFCNHTNISRISPTSFASFSPSFASFSHLLLLLRELRSPLSTTIYPVIDPSATWVICAKKRKKNRKGEERRRKEHFQNFLSEHYLGW